MLSLFDGVHRHIHVYPYTLFPYVDSYFTVPELKKLYHRYTKLNTSGDGVDLDSFCSQPEVSSCKLIVLAFDTICPPKDEETRSKIDFEMFVLLLSKFSPRSPVNEKTQFLYTCLTEQGQRPFDKDVYNKLLRDLLAGTTPGPAVDDIASVVWERLTKNSKKKTLSERTFANLFTQLDILNVCTIVM